MKRQILEIEPKYIIDIKGKKTQVVLDITTFEQMLEQLEDFYFALEADNALKSGDFVDFEAANKDILIKKRISS